MVEGDVFREVEQEMRRERMQKLWDDYGIYVLGAAFAIIALVAGNALWNNYQTGQAASASNSYLEAADALDAVDASAESTTAAETTLSDLAGGGPSGYSALARFRIAGRKIEAGKAEEARADFDALVADGSVDETLRGMAALRGAMTSLDLGDFTGVENRLTELVKPGNPWRHSATELLGLAAMQSGDREAAEARFGELLGEATTPPALRQRAQTYMELIVQADVMSPETEANEGEAGAESESN